MAKENYIIRAVVTDGIAGGGIAGRSESGRRSPGSDGRQGSMGRGRSSWGDTVSGCDFEIVGAATFDPRLIQVKGK